MRAYKTVARIQDPKKLVLENMPFHPGQMVEVLVLAQDSDEVERTTRLKALFKETQSLPQARIITEEEIALEIERYRSGR